ncbi:type II/IV secretion system protein [Candidatus Nomurabacteria bacterium]|nr:type II/IV secretion system protein [Candidatus Kaiserbacteria bacterium]MCB9815431.1 type II/IV secretion system protein [Candidatus Nomurabacteria bacterium]
MVQFDDSFSNSRVKELRTLEEERAIQTNAPQLGFPYVNLRDTNINFEALAIIPEAEARAALAVGFRINKKNLSIAVQNPNLPATQQLFQRLERQKYFVSMHMCSMNSLEYAWKRYADIIGTTAEIKGVLSIDSAETQKLVADIKQKSDVTKALGSILTNNNSRRITETISVIFAGALALGASDIHIEPEEFNIRLRYRLDGVLQDIADLDTYIHKRLLSRLKLLSGMVLNVKAEAQDGRFTFNIGEREVEVRSSIIPGASGESIVMRLLDPSVASFRMDSINLNPYIEKVLREQLKRPNGLIITTGPTGSGKTTALYSFLREINEEGKKIITIENPVEYKLEGIVHTQTDENYTFAQGLRAILRQDPDVIMVGEIRDTEVAETAFHAAQTGHLVFSTLHTNSAVAGFARLIDLGVNPQIMGGSINIIIGQRLARVLCEKCKVAYQASATEINFVKKIMSEHPYPPEVPNPLVLYKSVGCTVCAGTGFKGRVGVFEGIIMDDAVEEVVVRDPREHTILEAARPQKIPTMLQDGVEKALTGITSLQELERVIEFPKLNDPTTNFPDIDPELEVDFQSHVV